MLHAVVVGLLASGGCLYQRLTLPDVELAADADGDGDGNAGGDANTGDGDDVVTTATLVADPSRLEHLVDDGDRASAGSLETIVRRSDTKTLGALVAVPTVAWLSPAIVPLAGETEAKLVIAITADQLSWGINEAKVTVSGEAGNDVLPVEVVVSIAVTRLPHATGVLHVGPTANGCPRDDGGAIVTACDHFGAGGVLAAADAASVERQSDAASVIDILVYGNADPTVPALYDGAIYLEGAHLRGAPGQDAAAVEIVCGGSFGLYGVELRSDGAFVERLSFTMLRGCGAALIAWTTQSDPTAPTTGHFIDAVIVRALRPEHHSVNGIEAPFYIGSDTVVRNSYFYGYLETGFELSGTHDVRIVNNTIVTYQGMGAPGFTVSGATGLIIANNVALNLSGPPRPFVDASSTAPSSLTITDNIAFGFTTIATSNVHAGTSVLVESNLSTREELVSPLTPKLAQDRTHTTSGRVRESGRSLDGVDLQSVSEALPGAFQIRAPGRAQTDRVNVGWTQDTCDGPCDFTSSTPNAIQKAVWSAWPDEKVQVYPEAPGLSYAGNAVMSWGVTLRGMSEGMPVSLAYAEEDPELQRRHLWQDNPNLIRITRHAGTAVVLENLRLIADDSPLEAVVYSENPNVATWTGAEHRRFLRRLHIDGYGSSTVQERAIFTGQAIVVQDTLVHGPFASCIDFKAVSLYDTDTSTDDVWVANLTCRLSDPSGLRGGVFAAAFDVTGVVGGSFMNIVADTPGAPLFLAEAPAMGWASAATVTIEHSTYRGSSVSSATDIGLSVGESSLSAVTSSNAELFVSATDSHLDSVAGASVIDHGTSLNDPNEPWVIGPALDGTPRPSSGVDQGCYEQ